MARNSTPDGEAIQSPGRILLLTEDPAALRAQLAGTDLRWTPEAALRHEISTDEIIPAHACFHYDAPRLAEVPYTGLQARGERPVGPGDVRRGGFAVSVSGRRRGKGSSREVAPFAERAAGIRVVLAESFERIYRENCHHLGLLTSEDVALAAALARGEAVPLAAFLEGLGAVEREIVRAGGLMAFEAARAARRARIAVPARPAQPMTSGERILARHWRGDGDAVGCPAVAPGDEGFVRAALRFSHEYVTPMSAALFHEAFGADARVAEPATVVCFRDHLTFLDDVLPSGALLDAALELREAQARFAAAQGIRLVGELPRAPGAPPRGAEAICHAWVLEHAAVPGEVIVGSDSHTPHAGAIGAVAIGVGSTALAAAWASRDVRVRVPESVRVEVTGGLAPGVTAKDLVLALLARPDVRAGALVGRLVEYGGPGVAALDLDERATLTNMAAELGALTALVEPDDVVVEALVARRGWTRAAAAARVAACRPDAGASYAARIVLDGAALVPMLARPGDPGNGVPVAALAARVPIDIAYAGSCTGGKRRDIDMVAEVFAAARAAGRRVAPGVRCYVQFGSVEVRAHAEARGYLPLFEAVGAVVLDPSCGACINAGPGVSRSPETVTVSSINRNFPGRSGPGQVWLASPYTVAASAIAGEIAGFAAGGGGA